MPAPAKTFYDVLTDAVADFAEHGYDSEGRLAYWQAAIEEAARRNLISETELRRQLDTHLGGIYRRFEKAQRDRKPSLAIGVSRFGPEQLQPKMKRELDRRRLASAELIRLNRESAIRTTLQRFSGWATSVPTGGAKTVEKVETKVGIRKALASLPYEERRVLIDQGHKFTASLADIVAKSDGAIAAAWESNWEEAGYDYRKAHKARDGKIYAMRGSWADDAGLVKAGAPGWSDGITQPGEEVYCRCRFRYLFGLSQLPADMLTKKGAAALAETRK